MADLISREAAIKICKSIVPNTNPDFYNLKSKAGYGSWMHSNGEVCSITNIETKIEALPAVDAAPIIRCTNCKWWNGSTLGAAHRCAALHIATTGEFYCAAAERKSNAFADQSGAEYADNPTV